MKSVLIIEARFYDHIADGLLNGAVQALEAAGARHSLITVPGILEIPATLSYVTHAIQRAAIDERYDGFVTLGCAIRGESDHYHHVCRECMRGIQDLALAHDLAIGNGVLAVHDEAQALARALPEKKNIGGLAARACLRMIDLKRALRLNQA